MADLNKNKQIYELTARIEKLQSQKNSLLKELDQTEERFANTDRIYKKYFPYVIDLATDGNEVLSPVLQDLSTELKKGSNPARIEYIFKQLQDLLLKEEPVKESRKKKGGSLFSGLFKSDDSDYMDEFRQGYFEIVNRLKGILDSGYMDKLKTLSSRIDQSSDAKDIGLIRDDLFSLLEGHIADIGTDREKISAFVKEIVKRILQIESGIARSFDSTGDAVESSQLFGVFLNKEIGELKGHLPLAGTLDELKTQVSGTLSTIEDALKRKTTTDQALKSIAEKNRYAFQTGFAKLKTELEKATKHSKELEVKLNQDPLTGAFNRRAYNNRIEDEVQRFLRYGTIFSLLIIDADHFKKVNDNYGHAIGDKCLQEIIRRSSPHLRKSDMLARYGGEEFAVIMPETDGKGAVAVAEKIRQTIEKIEFIYKAETVRVTVSIGASQVKEGDTVHGDVFDRADTAVYKAKEAGRNRVVLN